MNTPRRAPFVVLFAIAALLVPSEVRADDAQTPGEAAMRDGETAQPASPRTRRRRAKRKRSRKKKRTRQARRMRRFSTRLADEPGLDWSWEATEPRNDPSARAGRDESEAARVARSGAATDDDADDDEPRYGLSFSVELGTAYVFRGQNVFQTDSQLDQNMVLKPGIEWSIGNTGFSLGYWAPLQISGGNVGDNIDLGVGAEQDICLGYTRQLLETLHGSATFCWYFNIGADETKAGTSFPSYLEPGVEIFYQGPWVGLGALASFIVDVGGGLFADDHLYLNPYMSVAINLSETVVLEPKGAVGLKIFTSGSQEGFRSNTLDLLAALKLSWSYSSWGYVDAAINLTWTNLEAQQDFRGVFLTEDPGVGDEIAVFGTFTVGVDL